jgi:hypothetical protein
LKYTKGNWQVVIGFEVYVKKLRGSIGFKVLSVLKCNYSTCNGFVFVQLRENSILIERRLSLSSEIRAEIRSILAKTAFDDCLNFRGPVF